MATEEYITITEAAERYGHTRAWWHERINSGELAAYDVPSKGKRGTFLLVSEIETYLQPKPRKQGERDHQGQDAR